MLAGPGMGVDPAERDEPAPISRPVHRPQRPQRTDVILHPRAAAGHRHPGRGELCGDVASREPGDQPPVRHHIQAGKLLGEDHRVAQRQHDDPAGHLDSSGVGGHQRQSHDRVEERQRGRHREAGRRGIGQHDMLAGPHRLKPGGLCVPGHQDGLLRVSAGAVVRAVVVAAVG